MKWEWPTFNARRDLNTEDRVQVALGLKWICGGCKEVKFPKEKGYFMGVLRCKSCRAPTQSTGPNP